MPKKSNVRLLPIVILPAIAPAVLLPLVRSGHVPDYVLGGAFGFSIGLSVVALFWMAKRNSDCAPSGDRSE